MAKNTLLTLEIREEMMKLCEIEKKKEKLIVHKLLQTETPEGAIQDGEIIDVDALVQKLQVLLVGENYKNKKVICTIHSSKVAQKEAIFPSLKKKLFEEMIQQNIQEYFPMSIDNYSVRYSILEELVLEKKKEVRVLLLAAPCTVLDPYPVLCQRLGLKLMALDYNGNSTQQLIKSYLQEGVSLILHLEKETTNIMIMEGKIPLFQRSIPYGMTSFLQEKTEREVFAYQGTLGQGEGEIAATLEEQEISERSEYLLGSIQRVMDYYLSRYKEKPIQKGYVLGLPKEAEALKKIFRSQLRVRFDTLDIDEAIEVKEDINSELLGNFISNIGAILKPINFKIEKDGTARRQQKEAYRQKIILAISMLASGALILAPYVQVQRLQSEKKALENQIQLISDIQAIEKAYTHAQGKVEDMNSFYALTEDATQRILTVMNDLERKMPQEMIFTQLTASGGSVSVSGNTVQKEALAQLMTELKSVDYISNVSVGSIVETNQEEPVLSFTIQFDIALEEGGSPE